MTLEVFPSLLPGEPIECHEWAGTLAAWMEMQGIDWQGHGTQPVVVMVNGQELPIVEWSIRILMDDDVVQIHILPGGGIFKAIFSIFNFLLGWLMPRRPSGNYNTPEGKQLEASQAEANQAKLGDAVPELAGRFRRFPEYLTPPRRYFVNKREQWLQFHACIGPGLYEIAADDVKVGDTPISALEDDGVYQIYAPGADLSAQPTAEHWHTTSEVGGTSSGTAGLELSTDLANRVNTDPVGGYIFSGDTITRTNGQFPAGWGAGTILSVSLPLSYDVTVVTVLPLTFNRFEGDFLHIKPLGTVVVSGDDLSGTFEIADSNLDSAGTGWITLTSSGSPVNSLTPGTYTLEFARPNVFYRIVTSNDTAVTVERVVRTGATYIPDSGFEGFPSVTAIGAALAYHADSVYGEWSSEFVATPGNELTTTIEVDVFFPRGLTRMNDEGELESHSCSIQIQYRDTRGGVPTTVSRTYTEATNDQIGFTETISVPEMRPAVRVRRVSAASTSVQIYDTVHWYGLKARISGAPSSYPNWTTMSVRLRSGGKLAAQSENQINVLATRKLPTLQLDGTWGVAMATRDISAFLRYIATTIGYTDANLDMDELQRLHAIWTSRGETVDYVFDLTTVKEAMNTVLAAGMSEFTIADGLIRPVRDDVRTTFESGQGYSPQNMTAPLQRQFRAHRQDDNDGIEVEYTDANTWTRQTVVCALLGSQRLKLRKMKLDGVTDRTIAWRIGMREARRIRYQLWQYSFETEMDALNSEYLSYVPLLDDIPGYGQSAILQAIEPATGGALLQVSEPLRWEEGVNHVVAYRRPDGTVAGPWSATPGPDDHSLIANIPQPWPTVTLKHEPPHIYFGTTERWCFPALITEIKPSGTDKVSVSAVNYDARIYADDNNAPAE